MCLSVYLRLKRFLKIDIKLFIYYKPSKIRTKEKKKMLKSSIIVTTYKIIIYNSYTNN